MAVCDVDCLHPDFRFRSPAKAGKFYQGNDLSQMVSLFQFCESRLVIYRIVFLVVVPLFRAFMLAIIGFYTGYYIIKGVGRVLAAACVSPSLSLCVGGRDRNTQLKADNSMEQ